MKLNRSRPVIRLLVLAALVTACAALITKDGAEACWQCVRLDPGSAIQYGCQQVSQGDTGCTPTDSGCRMANTWCREGGGGGTIGGGGSGGGSYCEENWMWDAACSGPSDTYVPVSNSY